MNKIYIRKIDKQAIEKQISILQETLSQFFDKKECIKVIGKKSKKIGDVKLLLQTDPRLGGDIKNIIKAEGGMEIGDFLLFNKGKSEFVLEIIKQNTEQANFISSLFDSSERHLELSIDSDVKELDYSIETDNLNESTNRLIGFNKIFYGIPGCGKSYKVASMLEFKKEFEDEAKKNKITKKVNNENIFRTTFYLDYSNSDFVGQIYPVVDDNGHVTYESVPGPFTKALVRAYTNPNEMIYLVIEEINRGNAAAIFGDLFQLLDRVKKTNGDKCEGESEYPISNEFIEGYLKKIISGKVAIDGDKSRLPFLSNHNIIIPNNLTIFATMNTSDQNVFPLDTAFKRRWNLEKVDVNWEKTDGKYKLDILNKCIPFTDMTWGNFASSVNVKMIENCKDGIITQDKNLGPFFVSEDMLVERSKRYEDSKENKAKLVQFVNNVIEYLFFDVTKFDHDVLFEKDIQYSTIYECFKELTHLKPEDAKIAKRYLEIFAGNIEDDVNDSQLGSSVESGVSTDGNTEER